ncbi:MAG: glutathione S-transferase family protein, partial [Stappiaceae bacterium]
MQMTLHLVSHTLCPYVQRAAISMTEKNVVFDRTDVDLANKPDWFMTISPLGKTPVLIDDNQSIFESVAILEYLEETHPLPLHPADAMTRAQHRGWIEFGSSILNDIAGFYGARDAHSFGEKIVSLSTKFTQLEDQ